MRAISALSARSTIPPVGFAGELRMISFVRGVAGGEHAEEEERLRARRDEHAPRIDLEAAVPREMLRARLPQRRQAGRLAVVRVTVAQRLRRRLDDVRRGREVRLADLEVDDPPSLRLERLRP